MSEKFNLIDGDELSRTLLDGVPLPVFLVDDDVRILDFNVAAGKMFNKERIYYQRSGEVLHCIHSTETKEGCGGAPDCTNCIIRKSVDAAFSGQKVVRQKASVKVAEPAETKEIQIFVSASFIEYKGNRMVLLVIEDISELFKLRSLLPICARCKKIRDDKDYWHSLESYMAANMQVDFTHGLCPDCLGLMRKGI
jgi:PAS domain-containing protein